MINKINGISKKDFYRLLLIAGSILYVIFAIIDGPFIFNDSPAYINMSISREPLYSLFLAFCRIITPLQNDGYLYVAIILQGILMAVATNELVKYTANELRISNFVSIGMYCFPYLVALLFRFVAGEPGEQFMYTNAILTEGLTISIHLLFVRFIFEYLRCRSRKSLIWSTVICFIGINIRKQMVIWLIILLLVVFFCNLKKKFVENIIRCIVISFIVLVISLIFDRTFNYIVNEQFSGHVNDNRFIATMIFYTSDSSDVHCIENEELKHLYLDIYESCKEQGLLKPGKEQEMGWFDRAYHFVCSYDQIQLRTMYPIIREQMPDLEYAGEVADVEQRLDCIISYYIDNCLFNNLPRMLSVYVDNVLTGFVTSVAQRNRVLSIYALLAYAGYFAGMSGLVVYGRKKGYSDELKGILIFAGFTILCIGVNVGVVAAVIFCQTRYMIYNMSLFYMAFLLMLQYIGRTLASIKRYGYGDCD